MTFNDLLKYTHNLAWFDLATVVQLSGEKRESIINQLYRWTRANKLIALRRGMYTLAYPFAGSTVNPAALAGVLYSPSYISGLWALSFYGLIPEKVNIYTSVTSRTPREFKNQLGCFRYQHVKQELFFGYVPVMLNNSEVMLGTPEKALLDFFHLQKGAWTGSRIREMRFQQQELVNSDRLIEYAMRFSRPRVRNAAKLWIDLAREETDKGIEL